jgi:DeoR/GlpR family transcriptional regulator of sugar metabolism
LPAKVRPSFFVLAENSEKSTGLSSEAKPWEFFATVRADFAFIGASGLDAKEGCSNTQLFHAEMTRAILARATRKILLADGAKWGRPSIIRCAE